jgi:hypothetical protein
MTHQQIAFGAADLTALGVRDSAQLYQLVGRCTGRDVDAVLDLSIIEVPYDIQAITTRCRQRVSGTARADGESIPFSIFVKVVQSWSRSAAFQFVPPEQRAAAAAMLPWQVEPLAYKTALARALPPGLRMPRAYDVIDLDDDSAAIWLEDIAASDDAWTAADIRRAAVLLGRFATSTAVREAIAPLESWIGARTIREYVGGRVGAMVPALRSDDTWAHPLVADHFDADLRRRTMLLVEAIPALLDELDRLPGGTCHGDACTRNLLMTRSHRDLVMIDFGFLRYAPLGFDLAQLTLGEIQLGERDPEQLWELGEIASAGYLDGLRSEGSQAGVEQVRRAHAVCMAIFSGLTAIPFELLGERPTERVRQIFTARAAVARYILDLVGC